jgi:plasmid stabilization system protein ParE
MKVLLRPEAEEDVGAAAAWYARADRRLARDFVTEVKRTISRIRQRPLQFPEVAQNVRRAILHRFPYAVYFVLHESYAAVVAILHTKRRSAVWEKRVPQEEEG